MTNMGMGLIVKRAGIRAQIELEKNQEKHWVEVDVSAKVGDKGLLVWEDGPLPHAVFVRKPKGELQ